MGGLIIAGDFNIHVNDVNSSDARQFIDAMEALGFDQLVDFCTHKSGNILDLMFTCIGNKIKCGNIKSDGFISDHCLIQSQLNLAQNSRSLVHNASRNFRDVDFESFWNDANLDELSKPVEDCENANYRNSLILAMKWLHIHWTNMHHLESSKRKLGPGEYGIVKNYMYKRCIVRNRERLWRKYLQDHLWIAFKIERNRYNKMLKEAKEAFIS